MKLTDTNFQMAVKVGGLLLLASTVGNVFVLLKHREVYREAVRIETEVQQRVAVLSLEQQRLEAVIREFGSHAAADPGLGEIFQRRKASIPEARP